MHLGTKERAAFAAAEKAIDSGLCAGTTIMTLKGETLIEDIVVGDRIITRDSGTSVVKDIKSTTANVEMVCIKAGSLGHNRPDHDMLITPGARLFIRDWRAEALFGATTAMVPAHRLVDGEFLSHQEAKEVTTYTLVFDREHVIYADGVEVVS